MPVGVGAPLVMGKSQSPSATAPEAQVLAEIKIWA